jgi:hypothetical protein
MLHVIVIHYNTIGMHQRTGSSTGIDNDCDDRSSKPITYKAASKEKTKRNCNRSISLGNAQGNAVFF